jgi:hypothetical protein
MRKVLIALSLIAALAAQAGHIQNMIYARRRAAQNFTIHFASGTPPATITLHAQYTGPASASAQYDPGDGVWKAYSSNTIAIAGSYIRFRGDWRTSAGVYNAMFYNTFAGAGYTVETSGALAYAATAANAYNEMFRGCSSLVALRANPFQPIAGSPAESMFRLTFYGNSLTSLPDGCMDTSGLTGPPAASMFYSTFYGNDLSSLPDGCLDTSGLTGSPAASMFDSTFNGNDLFSLPAGCMDTSGLTGSPAAYMFYATFFNNNLSSLPDNCLDTSGLTGSPAASMFRATFNGNSLSSLPAGCMDTSRLTGSPAASMFASTFHGNSLSSLPDGCLDTSGLTGSPAASMFSATFRDNNLQTTDFTIGSGITLTDANISTNAPLSYMFSGNADWTGQLYWGTNVIHAVLTPTAAIDTFLGCVEMPDYDTINANWK